MAGIETKAEDAAPVRGQPSWHGYYRLPGKAWRRACSDYGPIEYTSEVDAENGARVCAEQEIAKREED